MDILIRTIQIPEDYRKRTTLASNKYYDTLELYNNKVLGYLDGRLTMSWHFKDYIGIDIVNANLNSQFAQIVFLTGVNSTNRVVGIDLFSQQNSMAMQDTNRILFCSGMFSFSRTNDFADEIGEEIRGLLEKYKNSETYDVKGQVISSADEIKKYKELLDSGIISQEEFEAKKKQLLNL